MDAFDKFVKNELKAQYYGRYVDDFVIVHWDKQFLVDIQEKLRRFMVEKLSLRLHPRKVYLQHYSKGVKFIGAVIKPGRVYIGNRTKGNLYQKMREFNRLAESNKSYSEQAEHFVSSINSYLGFMVHYSTYKIRHKMIWENISPRWWPLIYTYSNAQKIVLKKTGRRVSNILSRCGENSGGGGRRSVLEKTSAEIKRSLTGRIVRVRLFLSLLGERDFVYVNAYDIAVAVDFTLNEDDVIGIDVDAVPIAFVDFNVDCSGTVAKQVHIVTEAFLDVALEDNRRFIGQALRLFNGHYCHGIGTVEAAVVLRSRLSQRRK